uniref:Alpha-galactosidase n=1 Tax=Romanomermis culicivorax TaxID=13658 RepID=A0A915IPP6_ROMCU
MLLAISFSTAITILTAYLANGLENGLARTPPMGWLSWLRFGCQTDCKNNPQTCISENLVVDMVDRMVLDGYKEAGYQYVNLDDCWLSGNRDSLGRLQADPARFPHGIKWLTDYVHKNGLKFGIYEDYGTKTCAGFPGSLGHIEQDAQTFADWGVDYVKFDACNVKHEDIDIGYPQMSVALNKTNRPMVYSCEWAFYSQFYLHQKPNYTKIRHYCNVWRVFDDIGTDWSSILKTIKYYDQNQEDLIVGSGPGGWNDPDMVSAC